MTLFQKILAWSTEIPPWQSDAIRRLLLRGELLEEDYQDLLALAKREGGIGDEKGRVPQVLDASDIPTALPVGTQVVLQAVSDLKNVNALVDGEALLFAEQGMTIIYGDNGSGKSGYARVLKRACRARDEESVLPNAVLPRSQQGVPEAILTMSVDGNKTAERWVDGRPGPAVLSTMSVFDGHCARVYLDDESDIAFQPYGLHLLEDLGAVCVKVKQRILGEAGALDIDASAFNDLKGPTTVGVMVAGLSAKTDAAFVDKLATLTEEERKRLCDLDAILKEGNPLDKAKILRARATRITRLAAFCDGLASALGEEKLAAIRILDGKFVASEKACELVSRQLTNIPGMLPGTGGNLWKDLLSAAQKYSVKAYPTHPFPHIGAGAQCLLCQQELAEGRDRYRQFGEFLANVAEEEMRKARVLLGAADAEFQRLNLTFPADPELIDDLKEIDQVLLSAYEAFSSSSSIRHSSLIKALKEHSWEAVVSLSANPAARLRTVAEGLIKAAGMFEQSADKTVQEKLSQERLEFRSRESLAGRKDAFSMLLTRIKYRALLTDTANAIDIAVITRKSRALAQEAVSEALGAALNQEFTNLAIEHLNVTFTSRGEHGKTLQKLSLNLPGSSDIARILSEGEQRALAIASFLAEVSLAPSSGGLIFDDPVSSLDHIRRDKVAARLVHEASKRQVVIFTHDLFFLGLLMGEAAKQQVPVLCQSVAKHGPRIGVLSQELPFAGQNTRERMGTLKALAQRASASARGGQSVEAEAMVKSGYDLLRQAWERVVEEVLLQGVVQRFDKGVHTKMLSGVLVEDDDFVEINNGMSRCSIFTGHDSARAGGVIAIDPEEFEKDVLSLESSYRRIKERAEATARARKSRISAPKATAAPATVAKTLQ